MSPQPFDQEKAEAELANIAVEWGLIGGFELERVYEFKDFAEALAFVNKLGELAEKQQHHPDIELSYGKVVIKLSTHSVGGLTEADFAMAKKIDGLSS